MRRAFTLIELLVVIAIILILCCCIMGPGGFDPLIALASGWITYPVRLASERQINSSAIFLCAACLAGLTIGVHYFGCWFARNRPTPTAWPWRRTLKLIGVLMLLFIAGITAIGITHEMTWLATTDQPLTVSSRFPAARTQARNNMLQIALAAHSHHDDHKKLPAGATFDATGRAMHGWQAPLLPYLEQDALHKKIDFTLPWNDPKNSGAMKQQVPVFMHPLIPTPEPGKDYAPSHFAGNIHVLGAKPMTLDDITDGTSQTLLFGEVAHNLKPWGMPLNCRDPSLGLDVPHGFASPRGDVVMFALADGTVRNFRADISPAVLKALSTPRGGEKIDQAELDR